MKQIGFTIYNPARDNDDLKTGIAYTILKADGSMKERKFVPDSRVVEIGPDEKLIIEEVPWPMGYTRTRGVIDFV